VTDINHLMLQMIFQFREFRPMHPAESDCSETDLARAQS
jgi:hypothetical protein